MTTTAVRRLRWLDAPFRGLLLAFSAGALLVTAFAPLGWGWMAFFCIATLFAVTLHTSPRRAFWRGLAFGYGLYGFGVSWVYVSLHVYGGMPLWMGSLAVLLFAGLLALFVALPCALAARLSTSAAHRLIMLVPMFLLFEWSKSWVLTGFPWLDLGYTQTGTWLFGWAPIGGVYLVSFIVLITAALILAVVVFSAKLHAATALILIGVSAFVLQQLTWSEPAGEPLHIGIVQPNTPIETKWLPRFRDQTISQLAESSHQLLRDATQTGDKIDLLVWPETALALLYQQTDADFWRALVPADTALITGIVDSPERETSYNAAVVSCDGEQQIYRKRHLVPFGEYMPLRFLFGWILDYLQLPMSDFASWSEIQEIRCGERLNIGLSICYEDAFADELRQFSGDATVLVNISEDAWFGDSLAPHQRLQMAQMRAREVARPLVRSGNSGPSGFINHRGEIEQISAQFEVAVFSHSVQGRQGDTPFKHFGSWIIWLSGIFLILLIVASRGRLPRQS